jgi:phosphoglycolate phosphatase
VLLETLTALIDQGRRLFAASGKLHAFAERIIKKFNLAPTEGVFGAELYGTRSDKTKL